MSYDADEVREHLRSAVIVRVPTFTPREGQPAPSIHKRVEELTDHALMAARWRSVLEADRLLIEDELHDLLLEWEGLEGWESMLTRRGRETTQTDIRTAKRLTRPDLYRSISDARHFIAQLVTAVRRLEKDEERGSRVYTFLTGG